ncbi:MAG: hypothetical protein M1457_00870 [bacterium]|nr:hypothetical protein [bacterium]
MPEVKLNPELHANALYFSPTMRHVRPGDRFVSTISFYNDKKDKADAADLWIQFDPRFIEPEWIDAAPLEKVAAAPPEMKVWGEQGFIRIKAAITGPLIEAVNPLATIHWRALAEVPSTRIELTAPPGESVSLLAKGKNIIPAGLAGSNARVDMLVRVALPAPETPGLRLVDDARRMLPAPPLEPGRRLRLAIVAPEREIPPGGVATADVVLLNPEREAFDDLKLRIRFDPQAVEVLDADEDNYITGGTNIFDGDFHEAFPFTSLGENRVDPAHGVISYRMGSTSGPMECGSGVVARIVYRMKRQSGWTAFWFERDDPLAPAPATDVAADGRSLLGPTRAIAAQALHGVQIPVGVGAAAGS